MAMTIQSLKNWIEQNQQYLHVTEVLAPISGVPSIVITLTSPQWDKVSVELEYRNAITAVQHRVKHELAALVQPPIKRGRGRPRKVKLFPHE